MRISFLSPIAAVIATFALLTLGAYLGRARRARRIRETLGLREPWPLERAPVALSLALVPMLLGLAAAQPVVERTRTRVERTDAQAFFALDTSRSMLAAARAGAPTRLERAREFANWLAGALPEIPVGLAAFNERMLPYVFPTTDTRVLAVALDNSIGIERPRRLPAFTTPTRTTTLDALAAIPTASYFTPSTQSRLLVVLTDGETNELRSNLARAFRREPRIETIFVRFWSPDERIYVTGVAEPGYTPDPASRSGLERVSSLVGGRVFDEGELGEIHSAAERSLGSGPTRARRLEGERLALMPYITLVGLIPLAYLLWRRNV